MKHRAIGFVALLLLLFTMPLASSGSRGQARHSEKVFIDWGGVGKELAIDTSEGRLRIRKPKVLYSPPRYRLDGLEFDVDQTVIEENYRKREIKDKLTVRNGTLFYDGAAVKLPQGVEMRNVWQAVLWNGWVICLGRTSKTDKEAKMKPPFFATELLTFSASERLADVKYLVFDPPVGIKLYILNSKPMNR